MKHEKLILTFLFLGALAAIFTAVSILFPKATQDAKDKVLGTQSWYSNVETLVGSSTNLKSVPNYAVFADATTTGDYVDDGSHTITQKIITSGVDTVLLSISAKAPTATSTLFIRQMGSQDGTNYFNIASSTVATSQWASPTTTIDANPRAIQFDPGTATTTAVVYPFDTKGLRYTRFIMWSEGWTVAGGDDVGVQAFVQAIKVEDSN
jgi:hypothetical protein